jgi:hypothetical protein
MPGNIWKINLYEKVSTSSDSDVKCKACEAIIKRTGRSTSSLLSHAKCHKEYAEKLLALDAKENERKNAMEKFVKILPKGML